MGEGRKRREGKGASPRKAVRGESEGLGRTKKEMILSPKSWPGKGSTAMSQVLSSSDQKPKKRIKAEHPNKGQKRTKTSKRGQKARA